MAVYEDREAFIPYRKTDVIELCLEEGKLNPEDTQKFREFCEILGAYYHFDFHKDLEEFKNNFAPFDPDADTKPRIQPSGEELDKMSENLMIKLEHIMKKANYSKLTDEEWERAANEASLITLNMDVDFDDFKNWAVYHRGDAEMTTEIKKMLGLKKIPFKMETYDRVVMLLRFKDRDYFLKKYKSEKKVDQLGFTPGKTYLYMYKNIPKADLEVIFPNVRISMNAKDKAMLAVPAALAAIPMLIKILPQLLIIIGVIAFLLKWDTVAKQLGTDPNTPMFRMEAGKLEKELEDKDVSTEIRKQFKRNKNISLSDEAKLSELKKDEWMIQDKKFKYFIRKESISEEGEVIIELNVYQDTMGNLLPIIVASLSMLVLFGSFGFKQFIKYKNKKIKFLKDVTDTLFFKSLVCNAGVFNSLIDSAEEEECKEVFLAYYHLLTHGSNLNQEALDDLIEEWLEKKFDTKIDFDVEKALEKMENIKGKIVNEGQNEEDVKELPLLCRDENGHLKVMQIDDAKTIIDYVWDNIFQYNVVLE